MKHLYLSFLLTFSWSFNLIALSLDIENLKLFESQSQGMKNTMSSELDEVITQFIEDEKNTGCRCSSKPLW